MDVAAEMLADLHTGKYGRHRLAGFLRQSVLAHLAGCEDVNDADRLCRDPGMRQLVGGRAVMRGASVQPPFYERFLIGVSGAGGHMFKA